MNDKRHVDIACTYEHHTVRAVLADFGDDKRWVPRSVILDEPDFSMLKDGQSMILDIEEWWAKKEGLI